MQLAQLRLLRSCIFGDVLGRKLLTPLAQQVSAGGFESLTEEFAEELEAEPMLRLASALSEIIDDELENAEYGMLRSASALSQFIDDELETADGKKV